jgi:murein L,D-transpeptidase YcbB/YkuD
MPHFIKHSPSLYALSLGLFLCAAFTPLHVFADVQHDASVSAEALLNAPIDSVEHYIQRSLNDSELVQLRARSDLSAFYGGREYQPYWVGSMGVNDRARDLLSIIDDSWSHGLSPQSYHQSSIAKLMEEPAAFELATLELLLSDAYLKLGQDLTGIRVDPLALKSRRSFWRQPLGVDVLLERLEAGKDVEKLVGGFVLKGRTYARLRDELRMMVSAPLPDYEDVLPIEMDVILRPGQTHRKVKDLRLRLSAERETGFPDLYDDD